MSDDEISALPKMTAYADGHFILAQVVRFFCEIIENIMGKGENTGYQHFLLFPNVLKKISSQEHQKVSFCHTSLW